MKLLDLVKNSLSEEDKKVVSSIDLEKGNDEIIANMITAGILKFDDSNHDQETS
jgi:hypothetical protein